MGGEFSLQIFFQYSSFKFENICTCGRQKKKIKMSTCECEAWFVHILCGLCLNGDRSWVYHTTRIKSTGVGSTWAWMCMDVHRGQLRATRIVSPDILYCLYGVCQHGKVWSVSLYLYQQRGTAVVVSLHISGYVLLVKMFYIF